jgi:hypothetical protein
VATPLDTTAPGATAREAHISRALADLAAAHAHRVAAHDAYTLALADEDDAAQEARRAGATWAQIAATLGGISDTQARRKVEASGRPIRPGH